eukprot:tig00000057_g76.t1
MRISGAFYAVIAFAIGCLSAIPTKVFERAIMYKESVQGAYHPLAASIAWTLVEFVLQTAEVALFDVVYYSFSGLTTADSGARVLYFAVATWVFCQVMYSFAELFALVLPSQEVASQAFVAVIMPMSAPRPAPPRPRPALSPLSVFAGFIISGPSIPNYWIWMVGNGYGFDFDLRWRDVGIMMLFFVAFKALAMAAATKIRYAKK